MAERIARVKIKREPGRLYYVKSDEEGWLCIYKTNLKGKPKTEPEPKQETKQEEKDDKTNLPI